MLNGTLQQPFHRSRLKKKASGFLAPSHPFGEVLKNRTVPCGLGSPAGAEKLARWTEFGALGPRCPAGSILGPRALRVLGPVAVAT